ncbi:MAG: porin [Rhizobiales bacterium]|nr:porin [Hyphomicrobiales bacterium]
MLRFVRRLITSTALPGIIAIAAAGTFGVRSAGAAPVEYVKVCSLYGAGCFYIPGTDTCVKLDVGAEGGWGNSHTNFNVIPNFDVNGTGGVWGVNGGMMFGIPGTPIYLGPRIGILSGGMSGTTSNPPASPTFAYTVARGTAVYGEVEFGTRLRAVFNNVPSGVRLFVSAGAASVKTNVTGTSGGFTVSDSSTNTGFTGAVGVGYEIENTPLTLTAQYRYINVPSTTINIPGAVPISGNINVFTFGAQWAFGGSSDRIIRTTNIRSQNR